MATQVQWPPVGVDFPARTAPLVGMQYIISIGFAITGLEFRVYVQTEPC